jgi:purine-binding chemotaxis protein CheW
MSDTYLTFTLAGETYAVEVNQVKEVLEYTTITKVPRTLEFMKGVINLRGSVVPVVDLRLKFGMEEAETTVDTSIIVMEVTMEDEGVTIGAVADSVEEVVTLDPSDIEPSPQVGTSISNRFIRGIGKHNERFVIILDIDKLFSSEEISAVADQNREA